MQTQSKDPLSPTCLARLQSLLNQAVPARHRHSHYLRWVRQYLVAQTQSGHPLSVEVFLKQIKQRYNSTFMYEQARHALALYQKVRFEEQPQPQPPIKYIPQRLLDAESCFLELLLSFAALSEL